MKHLLGWLSLACLVGCGGGGDVGGTGGASSTSTTTHSSTTSSTSGGGADGGKHCAEDCSALKTVPCTVAVCNTGQIAGPLDVCVVIPAPDGTACDDGLYCTTNDTCTNGTCMGGPPNDCGMTPAPCSTVSCDETSKSCSTAPATDGTACTPTDLCQLDGACTGGVCMGQPKDCTLSPLSECNTVACDSSTGDCTGTPDPTMDGTPCVLTGDLCSVGKTCSSGQCTGGAPKDCSAVELGCQVGGCQVGACDMTTGLCGLAAAAAGTVCTQGLPACQVGACSTMGTCVGSPAADGTACNDHDACTQGDTCSAGACTGTPVAGCAAYYTEGFETCPDNWTFPTGTDWQCGTPTAMSPVTPHTGTGVLATQLDGLYHNGDDYDTCVANSPPIDLSKATNPGILFWAWVDTEGGTFDGWNLKVSADNGQSFQEVLNTSPPLPLVVDGQPAWGGDLSAQGWQPYTAVLTPWAGKSVILQYAFRSDPAGIRPGVYIDDIIVAEQVELPLYITTPSQLPNVPVGKGFSATIAKAGGTSASVWSIDPGGVNDAWLSIDPATGVLSGTPSAAQAGCVSVTVRVEEPTEPSNFNEQTFTFDVEPDVYYTSFEGACPDGWTLNGDWKCGVPSKVGPATAFDGVQCLGTGMGQEYSKNDTWAGTTATSPLIDLTGAQNPTLTFRLWVDTDATSDGGSGGSLLVSSDGGASYHVLYVTPGYGPPITGEPAWSGDQAASGWQLVTADLTPYHGMKIFLRFAFRSGVPDLDAGPNAFAGVYVDDFLVQ